MIDECNKGKEVLENRIEEILSDKAK